MERDLSEAGVQETNDHLIFKDEFRCRILVVDDDQLISEHLERIISSENYDIYHACNGREALELAKKIIPNIIISDIVMPIMDGYELCQKVKSNKNLKQAYFIFLSSKSNKKDMVYGLKLGADDYLIKPFSVDELRVRIQVGSRFVVQSKKNQELSQQVAISESQASIASLCASMSHELNSPLGAISFNNKTLKKNIKNLADDKYKEMFESIVDNNELALKHMKNISLSIRKLTRPQYQDSQKVLININDEVETALLLVSHRMKNKKVNFVKKIKPYLPEFYFQEGGLTQVLVNLFTNALDAINGKGDITIEVSADREAVYINIYDSGPGIMPEILPYIFEPLYSTKDSHHRSGLGLSICKDIMKRNDGDIYVDNSVEGVTMFTVKCCLGGGGS